VSKSGNSVGMVTMLKSASLLQSLNWRLAVADDFDDLGKPVVVSLIAVLREYQEYGETKIYKCTHFLFYFIVHNIQLIVLCTHCLF
jgi:hypothetical protein